MISTQARAEYARLKDELAAERAKREALEASSAERATQAAAAIAEARREAEKATADEDNNDEDKENKADKQAAFWKTFEQMEEDEQLLILEKAERCSNAGDGAGAERAAEGSAPDGVSLG